MSAAEAAGIQTSNGSVVESATPGSACSKCEEHKQAVIDAMSLANEMCDQRDATIKKLERQRDEIASAYVKRDIDLHDEKIISGALRAAILNIASAADVLTGTKGAGVRKHIWKLAAEAIEASKPKKQNNQVEPRQ
jgi:hypothetical protein